MKQQQISRVASRADRKEQLWGAARGRHPEDPLLRRMLTSHVHCGEEMQLIIVDTAQSLERTPASNNGCLFTYRCACGFSFDSLTRPGLES